MAVCVGDGGRRRARRPGGGGGGITLERRGGGGGRARGRRRLRGRRVLRDRCATEHRGVERGTAQGKEQDLLGGEAQRRGVFTRAWAATGRERLRSTSASRGPRLSTRGRLASSSANSKSLLHPETGGSRARLRPSDHARGTLPTRRARRGPARGRGRAIAHLDAHPLRAPAARVALAGPDRGRRDGRLPDRHRARRARPAVLRSDRGDHHAGHHRRPARPARGRARARRRGRDRGRRRRSCS